MRIVTRLYNAPAPRHFVYGTSASLDCTGRSVLPVVGPESPRQERERKSWLKSSSLIEVRLDLLDLLMINNDRIFFRCGKPPELEFINNDRLPRALENVKKAAESTTGPHPQLRRDNVR